MHKVLRIYNPDGPEAASIRGVVTLDGYIKSIRGNEWVLFPHQRHYGIPLKRRSRGMEDRVEVDLDEAKFYKDISVERIPDASRETTP